MWLSHTSSPIPVWLPRSSAIDRPSPDPEWKCDVFQPVPESKLMSEINTRTQISAGGVAYRKLGNRVQVALISVADNQRWQLPKGRVDEGETAEITAVREVREEAGIETESLGLLERIEYWFYAGKPGRRTRIHKFVDFFLLCYISGRTEDHDREVDEARWVDINEAEDLLAFNGEKQILRQAKEKIAALET